MGKASVKVGKSVVASRRDGKLAMKRVLQGPGNYAEHSKFIPSAV
jgi:hypothetical protein